MSKRTFEVELTRTTIIRVELDEAELKLFDALARLDGKPERAK